MVVRDSLRVSYTPSMQENALINSEHDGKQDDMTCIKDRVSSGRGGRRAESDLSNELRKF